jgi:hypothetical protein
MSSVRQSFSVFISEGLHCCLKQLIPVFSRTGADCRNGVGWGGDGSLVKISNPRLSTSFTNSLLILRLKDIAVVLIFELKALHYGGISIIFGGLFAFFSKCINITKLT